MSLCPHCLAQILARAAGARAAIVEHWREMSRKRSTQEAQRRAELERKAQVDLEPVAKLDKGNGWGV